LEKIIVVCDGTTDGTDNKVLEMAKKNPLIFLVNDGKRKGKVERLMEIYKMNESDVVFVFDGDVVLSTSGVIENMVKLFNKKEIAVVGGNAQPTQAISFVEKLINKWFYIWYLARSDYNDGDTVHNISGCALGLRKDFAKKIVFPKYLISEARYIYFYALSKHAEFRFAKDAVVLFQSPQTLNDYLLQTRRSTPFTPKLPSIFGDYITEKYKIPGKYKTRAILTMMIKDPIFTVASAGFNLLSLVLPYKNTGSKKGVRFKSVESTKKAITLVVK
jgi:cellulose synthase/poly-beta-1,6-N-acetylglucosamine synthase-like glycosyltransferase